jgi:hypothetical protein
MDSEASAARQRVMRTGTPTTASSAPIQRRRAVSAPVSGGSRQPRDPAAPWVTMCTSISLESAITWPPMPLRTARAHRERRLVPITNWVALTPRAHASRACATSSPTTSW